MLPIRLLVLAGALLAGSVSAQKVFHTVDAALRLAFGAAEVTRTTEVLSREDRDRVEEQAGTPVPRAMVFAYVARRDGEVVGTAYFDTHRVRTLRETVMVVVAPDGRASKVVVCAFAEPVDYVPRESFYAQFVGRRLDDDLRLRRGIDAVSGATLTSRATTDCVRRALAIHRLLAERRAVEGQEEEEEEEREEVPPPPERRRESGGSASARRGEGTR